MPIFVQCDPHTMYGANVVVVIAKVVVMCSSPSVSSSWASGMNTRHQFLGIGVALEARQKLRTIGYLSYISVVATNQSLH